MNEIWKDIDGYVGLYQVSNFGRIKSLRKWQKAHCPDEYILKPYLSNNGYYQITLYAPGKKKKKFLIHRLVAYAFIPNPNGDPQVNHKDENRLNNRAENLEWCDAIYNNNYGTAIKRATATKSTPVMQLTTDGEPVAVYRSAAVAGELLGLNGHYLTECCNKGSVGYGYRWKYCSSFPS